MQITTLTLPELGFIVGTRGALGAGVALLMAGKPSVSARRAVGLTLVAIGALTTIPAAMVVFGRRHGPRPVHPVTPRDVSDAGMIRP